ncbi:hypothetical protein KCU78_g14210, partial [Aureobasidium melanogenum]
MSGMNKFVRHRNPEDSDDQWAAPHPERPATAQTTRNVYKRNGHHMYDTDTEDFDATRSSLHDQDYPASEASHDEEEYDQYGDSAFPMHPGNGRHAGGLELDGLMSQMEQHMARSGHANPDSYPPTTTGEPEPDENFEDEVDIEHAQAQVRHEQPRDLYPTKIPQKQINSTPLPIQSQPPCTQQYKDQFKVTTNPTISQKDVQRQKMPQSNTQVISQPVAKHVAEQFHATAQTATNHKSTARVPDSTHQQPARAQITTANHRQQHANEPDHYRQQHVKKVNHQDQHLDEFQHQQQYGIEEPPEDNDEQNTHSEEEEALDYRLEELYAKDFVELQNEPFNGPPREDVHDTQSDLSKPLSERLEAVAKLDVRRQKELFSSLQLAQWEEAGDWFQERFSEIFGKLKAARKKRREMASEFEQQIAQRQQALTKKRKITDDALSEMKKSGSLVLESTPKKKQRFRE